MKNNDKNKKLLSWSETIKIYLRAYAIFWKESPKMILGRVMFIVWRALTPYVGIHFSAQIISELSGERNPERLKMLVCVTLLSELVISIVSALLRRFRNIMNAGASEYFIFNRLIRNKLFDMDFCIADDIKTQDLLSTIKQNYNGGGWGFPEVLGHFDVFFSSLFTVTGGVALTVGLFTTKVPDTAGVYATLLNSPLCVAAVILSMLAVLWLSPMLNNKARKMFAAISDGHNLGNRLFGFFVFMADDKAKAMDIRTYRQELIASKYNTDKTTFFGSEGCYARLAKGVVGFYYAMSSAVSVILTGMVYLFVCLKSWAGAFDVGLVTKYVAAITKVTGNIQEILASVGNMRLNASYVKLFFEFIDIPNTMYQGSLTVEKRKDRDYEVEFKDVSFKYPGSDEFALKNVSFKFKIGERLAVVGENGSGKTTFIKLLCRLYDPVEGEILLNGINIRKYNYTDYMSVFSVVFQDFKLFDFGLGSNVAIKRDYDRELVSDCLYKAGFGDRLEGLEAGLDTYITKNLSKEGIELSGGEKQKVALARTLYKNSPFIVLDEPTAALDPVAEAEVYTKFNDIVEDKTAVYISHRLSSCRFCDSIIVFDNGRVIQQGTHEELLEDTRGKYHELWHAQAQYYA